MANITVSTSTPTITVDTTTNQVNVSQTLSNVVVGEVVPGTLANTIATSGRFETLEVGNLTTVQYQFPVDAPSVDEGLRAYANGVLYWSTDVGLVDSVNGYTGDVVLDTADLQENGNLFWTVARGNAAIENYVSTTGNLSFSGGVISESLTTDDIDEGTNLYYTNARVDAEIQANVTGGYGITFNADNSIEVTNAEIQAQSNVALGNNTTDNLTEGSTNLYLNGSGTTDDLTEGSTNLYLNGSGTTDDLAEGVANIWYTTARANSAMDAYLSVTDNSTESDSSLTLSSGVFTFTGQTTANIRGKFSAGSGISYDTANGIISLSDTDLISGVTAGQGLTGGGDTGNVTLDIGGGTGITVNADSIEVNMSAFTTTDLQEGANLYYTTDRANTAITTYLPNTNVVISSTSNITTTQHINTNQISPQSGNTITINGELEVDGNINYINVEDVLVEDNKIVLNTGFATARDAFIYVDRSGSGLTNASLTWDETNLDKWDFSNGLIVRGDITSEGNVDGDYFVGNISGTTGDFTGAVTALSFTGEGSDLTDVRAETLEVNIKNVSGGNIAKGTPVHQIASSGTDTLNVIPADASNAATMPAHAIAGEDLIDQAEGRGIIAGRISGVDTSLFQPGETIYVAVGGGYANVAPTGEANLIQNLGTVTKIDASTGGGEVFGAGRTAATPNLDDGKFFLGNAANQAATSDFTDEANSVILNYSGDISRMYQANISRISVGGANVDLDSGLLTFPDLQFYTESSAERYFIGAQLNAGTTAGVTDAYVKSRGNISAPQAMSNNDRLYERDYYSYDGTTYLQTFGEHIYHDAATAGVSTNVIPLAYEIYTKQDGNINAGLDQSIVKFRSDRTIVFNDTGTRGFGTNAGNANITMDGTINTVADINASGNINTSSNINSTYDVNVGSGNIILGYTNDFSTPSYIKKTQIAAGNGLRTNEPTLVLNNEYATTGNVDGGIAIYKSTGDFGYLKWVSSSDRWEFTNDGSTYYPIPTSTTDLAEGTNLYWTTDRGNAAIEAHTGNIANLTGELATTGNVNFEGGNVTIGDTSAISGLRNLKYDVNNNRLGIGTGDNVGVAADGGILTGAVHILSDNNTNARVNLEENRNSSTGPDLRYYKSRGTYGIPAVVNNADRVKQEFYYPYGGSGYGFSKANWAVYVDNSQGLLDSNNDIIPCSFDFQVDPNGTGATLVSGLKIRYDGAVTIGHDLFGPFGNANITLARSGNITTIGDVTANSFTDSTATLTGGVLTGVTTGNITTVNATDVNTTNVSATDTTTTNLTATTKVVTDLIDNYSGTNVVVNANLVLGTNPEPSNTTTAVQDVQAYNNGTLVVDSIGFSGGQIFSDGTQVYYQDATDSNVTPLNTLNFYLKWTTGDGGRYELYDDASYTTGSTRVTGGGYYTSGVGNVITASTANVTTSLYTTANVYSGNIINTGDIDTTTATVDNLHLKQFDETVVSLGTTNGDISSSLDVSSGTIFQVTANGNITINSMANVVAGTSATIVITQDATGNRALSSTMKFSNGGYKSLSTGNADIDIMSVFYDGSTYYATLTNGYA